MYAMKIISILYVLYNTWYKKNLITINRFQFYR